MKFSHHVGYFCPRAVFPSIIGILPRNDDKNWKMILFYRVLNNVIGIFAISRELYYFDCFASVFSNVEFFNHYFIYYSLFINYSIFLIKKMALKKENFLKIQLKIFHFAGFYSNSKKFNIQ